MRSSNKYLQGCVSMASVVLLLAVIVRELAIYNPTSSDYFTYVQAAVEVRHGADPYLPVWSWISHYSGGIMRADYFVYPPLLAFLLIPFTFMSFHAAFVLWGVCNALFLAGTVICTIRATGRRLPPWAVLMLVAAMSLLSPVRFELQWGQADLLLAFLVSASFLAARRSQPILGGLLLALAIVIKPPLALLVLFYLWKREWSLSASAIGGGALLFLAPFAILGDHALREQFAVWGFWSSRYVSFVENDSPRGVLTRLLSHTPYGPGLINAPSLVITLWGALVVALGVIAIAMVSRDSLRRTNSGLIEFSFAICTLLVASPLTEWIYLTLLIIPFVICAAINFPPRMSEMGRPAGRCDSGDSMMLPRQPGSSRRLAVAFLLLFGILCMPINNIEFHTWHRIAEGGLHGAAYVLIAAIYLYPLIAVYLLSLLLVRQECGETVMARLALSWRRAVIWRVGRRAGSVPVA